MQFNKSDDMYIQFVCTYIMNEMKMSVNKGKKGQKHGLSWKFSNFPFSILMSIVFNFMGILNA